MTHLKQIQQTAQYGHELTEFTFTSANQKVTTYLINGKILFPAVEICNILGFQNPSAIIKKVLDDDEYLTYPVDRAGQSRNVNLLTESGLYHLIFQSRKKEAKAFRRKVTEEILPEIRRNGGYLPKEQGLFKAMKARHINGRKMVPYRQFLLSVGYGVKSSGYHYTVSYSGHFVTMGSVKYVTEDLALHIFHARRVKANRAVLREMQPVLPMNFGDTTYLKGGSHVHN